MSDDGHLKRKRGGLESPQDAREMERNRRMDMMSTDDYDGGNDVDDREIHDFQYGLAMLQERFGDAFEDALRSAMTCWLRSSCAGTISSLALVFIDWHLLVIVKRHPIRHARG